MEKLTRNANQRESFNWSELLATFLGAVVITGLIYFFGNVFLGLN